MKPKIDPDTTKAIEKLLQEVIEGDPRLRLSDDEETVAEAALPSNKKSVYDVFQSHLNPQNEQAE